MIWPDRVTIAAVILIVITIIVSLASGVVSISDVAWYLPRQKHLYSDVEVGLAAPTLGESAAIIGRLIWRSVLLGIIPCWLFLRLVDFVICGKIRLWK